MKKKVVGILFGILLMGSANAYDPFCIFNPPDTDGWGPGIGLCEDTLMAKIRKLIVSIIGDVGTIINDTVKETSR